MCCQQIFKAEFQIFKQSSDVNTTKFRLECLQVSNTASVHPAGTTKISTFEMEQTNGSVNQSVKERFFRTNKFRPKVFENVVAFKELTFVEQTNSMVDAGIIGIEQHDETCVKRHPMTVNPAGPRPAEL